MELPREGAAATNSSAEAAAARAEEGGGGDGLVLTSLRSLSRCRCALCRGDREVQHFR